MNQAMPERLAVCFTGIYLQRFACYSEKVAEAIGKISADDVCTIFNAVMNTTSEKVVKKNKKI